MGIRWTILETQTAGTKNVSSKKCYNIGVSCVDRKSVDSNYNYNYTTNPTGFDISQSTVPAIQLAIRESEELTQWAAVKKWLKDTVGLPQYGDLLMQNGFDDLECVRMLTMNDLNMLGIEKIGHKMNLMKYIDALNGYVNPVLPVQGEDGETAYI